MKTLLSAIVLSLSLNALAATGNEVFIRGKIGGDFDDKKVRVTDSLGQSYYLAKNLFPKDFKFKQGESFAIEVPEKEVAKIKLLKK